MPKKVGPGRREEGLAWNNEDHFHVRYWQEKWRLKGGPQGGRRKARGYGLEKPR